MSRRLSIQFKNAAKSKPKVKFTDELVFLDSIKDNDVASVRNMLRRASANIDINKINECGLTALHKAVLENSLELVKLLIENKADINKPDEDTWTPLHAAASMGYYDVVSYLLENGANPNALTEQNERPIDLIDHNDLPLISLLLSNMNLNNSNTSLNTSDDYDINEHESNSKKSSEDSIYYYNKIFTNIFKSNLDVKKAIEEIESTIDRYDKTFYESNKFIKCLVNSICESSMNKNQTDVDRSELKAKFSHLDKYFKDNRDLQLDSIRAIYRFYESLTNPSSELLKKMFVCLYETKFISSEVFLTWRDKDLIADKKKIASCLKFLNS